MNTYPTGRQTRLISGQYTNKKIGCHLKDTIDQKDRNRNKKERRGKKKEGKDVVEVRARWVKKSLSHLDSA